MTNPALLAWVSLLIVGDFFIVLAGYSLRDFSRSRLDEICRQHGRESRFGVILKRHELALLAVEILFGLVSLLLAGLLFGLLEAAQSVPPDGFGWIVRAVSWLALAATLLFALLVLPWAISRVAGERYLYLTWPLISALLTASRPLLWCALMVDTFAHRLSGLSEPAEGDAGSLTEEIRSVVDEGQREGVIESEAHSMIHRVMQLQEEDAAAVMTPRTDMFCIQADETLEEARRLLLEAGHTRVPVIGESTDDIVGILYAKDLLRYLSAANEETVTLRDIVREPFYIPDTTGADTLLENMKRQHVHMAIVLDEYSGVAGLVTMEDILEEIVGEIVDEYDADEDTGIYPLSPGVVEVESRVHIDDLNDQFDFDLPKHGDFETIGGFVFSQLGRVPHPGDSLTWQKLRVTVLQADKRRIHRLRIEVDETLAASMADKA